MKLEISALEVYCDQVRDLFSESDASVDLKIDPLTKKVAVHN